jgi:hypothetical protein
MHITTPEGSRQIAVHIIYHVNSCICIRMVSGAPAFSVADQLLLLETGTVARYFAGTTAETRDRRPWFSGWLTWVEVL